MPELAEAGYDSLWVPPPTKGSGGLSVGYDLWDRFDLGSKDQRNTVSTRYGTESDLLRMVETAHRFGIRVYFDNIMNHNAFDIPGSNADTPIDIYPGMVPEDFHLKKTGDGFYRKWDNTRSYGDAWQVQHLGLADLIDIAQEPAPRTKTLVPPKAPRFPRSSSFASQTIPNTTPINLMGLTLDSDPEMASPRRCSLTRRTSMFTRNASRISSIVPLAG